MHIKVPANTPQPITGDRREEREQVKGKREGREYTGRAGRTLVLANSLNIKWSVHVNFLFNCRADFLGEGRGTDVAGEEWQWQCLARGVTNYMQTWPITIACWANYRAATMINGQREEGRDWRCVRWGPFLLWYGLTTCLRMEKGVALPSSVWRLSSCR